MKWFQKRTISKRFSIGLKITILSVLSTITFAFWVGVTMQHLDDLIALSWTAWLLTALSGVSVIVVQWIIALMIRGWILRPIQELSQMVNEVAGGNFKQDKMRFHAYDELGDLSASMNIMVSNTRDLVDELHQVSSRTKSVLDNTGQGFLTFGTKLMVDDQYSVECRRIFGFDIKGIPFPLLLYPDQEEQRQFLYRVFSRIFEGSEGSRFQSLAGLLPQELIVKELIIRLNYKLIEEGSNGHYRMMVVLTDLTHQRELESRMSQERTTMKMVVKVISNMNDFVELVKDYQFFTGVQLPAKINTLQPLDRTINEMMRTLHTFKGNFSQLHLKTVVRELHQLETTINAIRMHPDKFTDDDFKSLFSSSEMMEWLESDIRSLKSVLGDGVLEQYMGVRIDRSHLMELENVILNICPPYEARRLVADVRKLMSRPFRELIVHYVDYVNELSLRLNKPVHPLVVDGGDIPVDFEFYQNFAKALVHIFRNMIDHGIESPEERAALHKDESGNVKCEITFHHDRIQLRLSDDGRGIDSTVLRDQLIEQKRMSAEEVALLSDDDVLTHIFDDGFSTISEITDLSGRGVGLAALKYEVDKLGGSIHLRTHVQRGTVFEIKLPLISKEQMPDVRMDQFMIPLLENAVDLLKRHFGVVMEIDSLENTHHNRLELGEITSFLNVRGIFEGTFVYSIDRDLAREQVRSYVLGEIEEEEVEQLIDDVVAECLNVIIGQSFKLFSSVEELIRMETPVTLHSRGSTITYHTNEIWTAALRSHVGEIRLSFVLMNDYT